MFAAGMFSILFATVLLWVNTDHDPATEAASVVSTIVGGALLLAHFLA